MQQTVKIGKTKIPTIYVVAAGGLGLLVFFLSRSQGSATGGELGVDQTVADMNNLESLRGQVEEAIGRLNDALDGVPDATVPPVVVPGGTVPPPVQVDGVAPRAYPTPDNPLTPDEIAPKTSYNQEGLGALVSDVFGPTQLGSGLWAVSDNWLPTGQPKPVSAPVADPATLPRTKVTPAPVAPVVSSTPAPVSTFTVSGGAGKPGAPTGKVIRPPVAQV